MPGEFPPPGRGATGVYRCRDHYHVGFLMEPFNWDDDPELDNVLCWEESGTGKSFERASEDWVKRCLIGRD